jgi:hypothetical protein
VSDRDLEEERRLRRAAVTRHGHVPEPADAEAADPPADDEKDDNAAAQRLEQRTLWVDLQIRQAMARGDFDDLPGAGKPLRLPETHDPDWWVKRLIERERLTGVAPPAIGLRREDAELDETLDLEATEQGVRRLVDDFNRRVVEARRQLQGGPPVVTPTRDPDHEVQAWRDRRAARIEAAHRRAAEHAERAAQAAEASRAARRNPLRRLLRRSRRR